MIALSTGLDNGPRELYWYCMTYDAKAKEECHLVDTARITANTYMRDFKVSRWNAYCWMLDQALRQNFATVVIR